MKNSILHIAFLIFLLSAQLGHSQTVTDYFMSMPEHLLASYAKANRLNKLSNFTDKDKFRKSLIKIEDTKNSYLRLSNKTMRGGGYMEIVVFKKLDKSDLIIIADNTCDKTCEGRLQFLTCNNGKWVNVTFDYINQFDRHHDKTDITTSSFNLPRFGDKMRWEGKIEQVANLKDGSGTKTYTYDWTGRKFIQPLLSIIKDN